MRPTYKGKKRESPYVLEPALVPLRLRFSHVGGPGCYLGSFVSLPIWGAACNGSTVSRWHLTFYISGGLAVAWSALWAWIARSSPSQDPSLTQEEREYVFDLRALLSNAPCFVVVRPWLCCRTSLALLSYAPCFVVVRPMIC